MAETTARERATPEVTHEDVAAFTRSLRAQGTPWADGCANVMMALLRERDAAREALLWIPVAEMLPKKSHRVLVSYRKAFNSFRLGRRRREVYEARYSGGAWRFLSPNLKTRKSDHVTHWMPLPAAPKTELQRIRELERAQINAGAEPATIVIDEVCEFTKEQYDYLRQWKPTTKAAAGGKVSVLADGSIPSPIPAAAPSTDAQENRAPEANVSETRYGPASSVPSEGALTEWNEARIERWREQMKRVFVSQSCVDTLCDLAQAWRRAREAMEPALRYIQHVGANHTMRGEPHPQQWIVDLLERALKKGTP